MYNYDNGKRGGGMRLMLAICLTAVLSVGLLSRSVPTGYGYAADGTCRITGLVTHSTFHYEFTRVLAVAAGFDEIDAERIAVANEATDSSTFTGYPIRVRQSPLRSITRKDLRVTMRPFGITCPGVRKVFPS